MSNWIAELINKAHKDANEWRKQCGLDSYPFEDVQNHLVDPFEIVRSVMVDHGFATISNVECACGCHELMTYAWMNSGRGGSANPRKYKNGHKPKERQALSKNQELNRQASAAQHKHSDIVDYSPTKIKQIYEALRVETIKEQKRMGTEIQELKIKLASLERAHDITIDSLHNIECALQVLDCMTNKTRFKALDPMFINHKTDEHLNKDFGNESHSFFSTFAQTEELKNDLERIKQ